jgi:hypothetical protein
MTLIFDLSVFPLIGQMYLKYGQIYYKYGQKILKNGRIHAILAVLSKESMISKEKKLVVLHQLSQEIEPINLPDLLKKLGEGYSERSVRRWLAEMINTGLVEKYV